jgi:hypothetical protein
VGVYALLLGSGSLLLGGTTLALLATGAGVTLIAITLVGSNRGKAA